MRRIMFRPQARVDLLKIWHYIAPNSLSSANRLIEKVEAAIRGLAEMPGKGHTRYDVRDARYRFWSVRPYVIAYVYDDALLTVVRIVHGARNFRRLFKRG